MLAVRMVDLSVHVWNEPRYQSGYVRLYDPEISPSEAAQCRVAILSKIKGVISF